MTTFRVSWLHEQLASLFVFKDTVVSFNSYSCQWMTAMLFVTVAQLVALPCQLTLQHVEHLSHGSVWRTKFHIYI